MVPICMSLARTDDDHSANLLGIGRIGHLKEVSKRSASAHRVWRWLHHAFVNVRMLALQTSCAQDARERRASTSIAIAVHRLQGRGRLTT